MGQRLTLRQMEEFYQKMKAAELPEAGTWSTMPHNRDMVLNYLGQMIDELEYIKKKSVKLKEDTKK